MSFRKILATILPALISLGFLYVVFDKIDLPPFEKVLHHLNPITVALTSFIFALQFIANSFRLLFILKAFQITLPWQKLVSINTHAALAASFFFGGVGEVMAKYGQLMFRKVKPLENISIVMMDKYIATLSSLTCATFSLYFVHNTYPTALPQGIIALFVLILVGAVVTSALLMMYHPRIDRLFKSEKLNRIIKIALKVHEHPALFLKSLSISLFGYGLYFIGSATLIQGLDLQEHLPQLFLFVPFVTFLTSLPISFNGWGIREYAWLIIFGLVGLDRAMGATYSIALGIMNYGAIAVLYGFLLYLRIFQKSQKSLT